jgi:hypothetical protein
METAGDVTWTTQQRAANKGTKTLKPPWRRYHRNNGHLRGLSHGQGYRACPSRGVGGTK